MCLANDQIGRGEHEGKDNVVGVRRGRWRISAV